MKIFPNFGSCIHKKLVSVGHCHSFHLSNELCFDLDQVCHELWIEQDHVITPRDVVHIEHDVIIVDRVSQLSLTDLHNRWHVQFASSSHGFLECLDKLEWLSKAFQIKFKDDDVVENCSQLEKLLLTGACMANYCHVLSILEENSRDSE